MRENQTTKKIVMAAMLAALTCVATMVQIPSPLKGYLNLGDGVVLLIGWLLNPVYGFLAAGIGSALADLFSGYVMYAPATFLIKGMMALISCCGFKLLHQKIGSLPSRILSGVTAEIVMILGYFVFEGFLYGFGTSATNTLFNGMQGSLGLILGCVLVKVFEKNKISL